MHFNNFIVSKLVNTCDPSCSSNYFAVKDTLTANSNNLILCTSFSNPVSNTLGWSALLCYQCSASSSNVACRSAQTGTTPKTGNLIGGASNACTHCYVSALFLQHATSDLSQCKDTDFRSR